MVSGPLCTVRRQDAAEVAVVAQKKKAGEDATFELMASDFAAYTAKHLDSTVKRFEGSRLTCVCKSRIY